MQGLLRLAVLVAAAGCATPTAAGPGTPPVVDGDAVDAVFAALDGSDRPGCSLAIMHRGEILYARGYGMADLGRGIPNGPDTVFRIASTSKQVTAACVQLLALEDALSLDDPVRRWIPELPDWERAPTVRQLIHHSSGIRDYLDMLDGTGLADEEVTEAKVLELLGDEHELRFVPGTEFRYSNSNYFLLAVLVERVSGQRLRAFAAERVFAPLGMEVSHYRDDHREEVPGRALGYAPDGDGGWRLAITRMDIVGDGGVLTTVREFARWMDNYRTGELGGRALSDAMLAPGWEFGDGNAYASGIERATHRGHPVLLHGGAWVGYRAEAMYFPEQELAVLCFANAADARPTGLCFAVADLLLAP